MKLARDRDTGSRESGCASQGRGAVALALSELEVPGRKPCLVLLGRPARKWKVDLGPHASAEAAGFFAFRSDVVRKELRAGRRQGPSQIKRVGEDFYTDEWNDRTYQTCLAPSGGNYL